MKHLFCMFLLMILCLNLSSYSQTDPVSTEDSSEILSLKKEMRQLRQELDSLKTELSMLRIPVIPVAGSENGSVREISVTDDISHSAPAINKSGRYWISKSGKRHNSTCRYYRKPGGNPCGKSDGVPCKLCGG